MPLPTTTRTKNVVFELSDAKSQKVYRPNRTNDAREVAHPGEGGAVRQFTGRGEVVRELQQQG